jgi:hypothetical protein
MDTKQEFEKIGTEGEKYLKKYAFMGQNMYDLCRKIENEGGVKKSTVFFEHPEMWGIFAASLGDIKYKDAPKKVITYFAHLQEEIFFIGRDPDIETIEKINKLLEMNSVEVAAIEYDKLIDENIEIMEQIQKKLDEKFGQDLVHLDSLKIEYYILQNKDKFTQLSPGDISLKFDKNGVESTKDFPAINYVPHLSFGSFKVLLNSQIDLKIELKDSILISSEFSTGCKKPLYVDSNENFYFKSREGLSLAQLRFTLEVSKKLVFVLKVYKCEKYVNEILVSSKEFISNKIVEISK